MQANTGSGLYIRKGHSGAFKTTETITASSNSNWMPVTSVATTDSTTSLAGATAFKGSFGVLKGIKSSDTTKLEYTAVTPDTTKDGDAYTATGLVSSTDTTTAYGIYYHFYIDYMITATKSLKVTATATPSVETTPNIAQATRVGIIEASAVTMSDNQMTNASYKTEGKEYTVAAPAKSGDTGTDYNYEELKALGYEGDSEYKEGLTALYGDSSNVTFSPTTTKTSDEAFAYGSLSIYVWFDGTDKSCTNAIFS